MEAVEITSIVPSHYILLEVTQARRRVQTLMTQEHIRPTIHHRPGDEAHKKPRHAKERRVASPFHLNH